MTGKTNPHWGTTLDAFLTEEGMREPARTGALARVTLTPARVTSAGAVRRKLADLGITDADVTDTAAWARRHA